MKKIPVERFNDETIDIPVTKMIDPSEIEARVKMYAEDYRAAEESQKRIIDAEAGGYIIYCKGIPDDMRVPYFVMYNELKEEE